MELESIIRETREKLSEILMLADDLEMLICEAENQIEQNRR